RGLFLEYMDDDFNTGGGVGMLYELLTTLNRFADAERLEYPSPKSESVTEFEWGALRMKELGNLLGLFHERQPRVHEVHVQDSFGPSTSATAQVIHQRVKGLLAELNPEGSASSLPDSLDELMNLVIDGRAEARKAKNFAVADRIRKRLGELGITL